MTIEAASDPEPRISDRALVLASARLPPYEHQLVGVAELAKMEDRRRGRVVPGAFFLADEPGAGKTKQVIDTACLLFHRGEIDRVITIGPASSRDLWYSQDEVMGELAKHLWRGTKVRVIEYHGRSTKWEPEPITPGDRALEWLFTNYEFVRSKGRLEKLVPLCTRRTWLVLDEAANVKNARALQTRAVRKLRRGCGRVTLLNGTPIAQSPADLYSQSAIMGRQILECDSFFQFRARYAVMGGWQQKQVVGWRHAYRAATDTEPVCCDSKPENPIHSWDGLGDLQRRLAPYVLRRLKVDCLDLPPKLPPVVLTARLTPETWAVYKEMREELVAWLGSDVSAARQAGVKVMRLAQITSGFLGGLRAADAVTPEEKILWDGGDQEGPPKFLPPREVGREKLGVVLGWIEERLAEEPTAKLLVWCRFRDELERLQREAAATYPNMPVLKFYGGQATEERQEALALLKPGMAPAGPGLLVGTQSTGKVSVDFAACHYVLYCSNENSLMVRLQSEDRPHRPGQTHPIWYGDVVAVGPQGQQTVDHIIIRALRRKESIANWTTSAWVSALREE